MQAKLAALEAARKKQNAQSATQPVSSTVDPSKVQEAPKQPTAVYVPTGENVSIVKVHHDRNPVCFTVSRADGSLMEATKEMLRPAASKARSDKDKKKTKRSHHGRKSTSGKDDRSLIRKALDLPKGTPPEMTDENTNQKCQSRLSSQGFLSRGKRRPQLETKSQNLELLPALIRM